MIISRIDNTEEEEDVLFNVIRITADDFSDIDNITKSGLCKIIAKVDNIVKTFYYRNGKETSKETILQIERIKKLRR